MSFEQADRYDFRRWVRATFVGWLIGFVLVIVLALAWDMIGGGAQFMVGIGLGAGVGYMQSRVIGEWIDSVRPWLWASIIGMGMPFVLWDIGAAIGIESLFSLPRCVLVGGLLVGLLQRRLLSVQWDRANWWVPASVVGWSLPAGILALGDLVGGGWGGLALGTAMLLGGAVLGAVTGGTLIWMRLRPAV